MLKILSYLTSCNTVLISFPSTQTQLSVDKLKLQNLCIFFEHMLSAGMGETHTNQIELPNISPNVMRYILDDPQAPKLDLEFAIEIIRTADYMLADTIRKKVTQFIVNKLDTFSVDDLKILREINAKVQSIVKLITDCIRTKRLNADLMRTNQRAQLDKLVANALEKTS